MSKLIKSPSITKPLSTPTTRLRKWSFNRSKEKKAQDNHFVRTNSGRWIKTEHPLISTDDEDDEARRRREQQQGEEDEEQLRQQSSLVNGQQSNHGHYDTSSPVKEDGPPKSSMMPAWHTSKPPNLWHPHSNPQPSSLSSSVLKHAHTQSQPSNSYFPSSSISTPPISSAFHQRKEEPKKLHTPPAPVPFPSMNYVTQPSPKMETDEVIEEDPIERPSTKMSRRVKYKPGALYPLHNDIPPDLPYTNWHLRPPDLDLPPIFIPKGYNASGGGAASGSSGGAAPSHDKSANASSNGVAAAPSPSPVKEGHPRPKRESKDRSHPPTVQPTSTNAILGHSASSQSLSRTAAGHADTGPPGSLTYPNYAANVQALLSPRPQVDAPMLSAGESQARILSPMRAEPEPGTLDVSDPLWGTTWSHASPYDLGRTPLTGIRIPAPVGGGMHPNNSAPVIAGTYGKRRIPSPSPLGGLRLRRPSADAGERSRRPSRERSTSRPPSPGPSRPAADLSENHTTTSKGKKLSASGLRGLFAGSAPNLPEDGVLPRTRKRTISLGQTGIGIALGLRGNKDNVGTSLSSHIRKPSFEIARKLSFTGAGGGHVRKPSFEVVRKPSVKPGERPDTAPNSTSGQADDAHEVVLDRGRSLNTKVLPDAQVVSSPTEEVNHQSDLPHTSRGTEELNRKQSRSSKDLVRTPSGSTLAISHPLPLQRTPSSSSMTPSIRLALSHKKSVSHLGHGDVSGVGLGRRPSLTATPSPTNATTPPRGHKTSKPAPPRTLNKYAQHFAVKDLPRSSKEPFLEGRGGEGAPGVFGRLAKKLSWITKSAKDKEREQEVEEKQRMFEKERDIERKLEDARNSYGHQLEDRVSPERRERRSIQRLDDPDDDPMGSTEASRAASRMSSLRPPSGVTPGVSDTELSGTEAVKGRERRESFDYNDPRSPSKGRNSRIRRISGPGRQQDMGSPTMSHDNDIAPMARLAVVMMTSQEAVPAQSVAASPSATTEPLVLSPPESLLSLNTSPILGARYEAEPSPSDRGHLPAHAYSAPPRGPSPIPPRPGSPVDRRESPVSIQPRMELQIMNPDAPSPPTPTRDLPATRSSYERHSVRRHPPTFAVPPPPVAPPPVDELPPPTPTKDVLPFSPPPRVPSKSHKPVNQAIGRAQGSSSSSATESSTDGSRAARFSSDFSSSDGQSQAQTPFVPRQEVASVYSRPHSSTLTLTSPSTPTRPTHVSSPLVNYVVAPPAPSQPQDSQMFYSPQHHGLYIPAQLSNGVSVMLLHQHQSQTIPAMPHMANQTPGMQPLFGPSSHTYHRTDSSGSLSAGMPGTEPVSTTVVQPSLNYQPATMPRPAPPVKIASDPAPRRTTADSEVPLQLGRPMEPSRRETANLAEKAAIDEATVKRRSDSRNSKPLRRSSTRQYESFGGTVTEEFVSYTPHEATREMDKQIRAERDNDRERARQFWEEERSKVREKSLRKLQQRQESRDLVWDHEASEAERPARITEPADDRQARDGRRESTKLKRTGTGGTIPPSPPPKNDVRPPMPSSNSSPSAFAQDKQPSRLSRSRRDPPTDMGSPTRKASKLSKSNRGRPPAPLENMDLGGIPAHHLEEKPLPRPMSEVRVEQDLGNIRANEAFARDRLMKGTSLAMDRSLLVEHVLGRSGPVGSPASDFNSLLNSPMRQGLSGGPGAGTTYTSFNLQSPFLDKPPPLHRPQVTYIPAPLGKYRSNPLPRPPRDTSLDIRND